MFDGKTHEFSMAIDSSSQTVSHYQRVYLFLIKLSKSLIFRYGITITYDLSIYLSKTHCKWPYVQVRKLLVIISHYQRL